MRKTAWVGLVTAILLFGSALPSYAWQRDHRRHAHVFVGPRVFVGHRVWWGPVYAYPYYNVYSPPVIIQQAPPVYVQPAPPQPPYYWYYCENSRAYYPYVQECPGGWMTVVPQR